MIVRSILEEEQWIVERRHDESEDRFERVAKGGSQILTVDKLIHMS